MPRYVITQMHPLPEREWTFYDWFDADWHLRKLEEQDYQLAEVFYRQGKSCVVPTYKFEEFPDDEMVISYAA